MGSANHGLHASPIASGSDGPPDASSSSRLLAEEQERPTPGAIHRKLGVSMIPDRVKRHSSETATERNLDESPAGRIAE